MTGRPDSVLPCAIAPGCAWSVRPLHCEASSRPRCSSSSGTCRPVASNSARCSTRFREPTRHSGAVPLCSGELAEAPAEISSPIPTGRPGKLHPPSPSGKVPLTSFDTDPMLDRRAGVLQNEPDNPLRHYAGVLRRRARWIIVGLVVGVVIGGVASLLINPKKVTTHYYKATNTLIVNGGAGMSSNATYTLPMAGQLIQSQELLTQVGKKVKLSPVAMSKVLSATVRSDQYALDVTGISTDPRKAEVMANTAASLLDAKAADAARAQYQNDQNDLFKKKDKLAQEQQDLQAQIVDNPDLQPKLSSVTNQLTAVWSQIEQLGTEPPALSLTTLQPAHAIEINQAGYNYRRKFNINTPGQLVTPQNDTTTSQALANETDLSGPATLSKGSTVLIGGGVGLLLGLVGAFVIEAWDDRIRSRTRVEELCDLPVLAEIPNLTREQASTNSIAMLDSPKSPTAERYRATCTAVLFALGETATERPDGQHLSGNGNGNGNGNGGGPRSTRSGRAPVILVTSPGPGEGKTTTSANLAAAFADTGRRVLVVDADFRRPALGRFLNPVPNLVDPNGPATTHVDGVAFLSSPRGIDAPGDVVFELRRLIDARQEDFDVVVVDTPPMLTTNDATDLLAAADAVVLVVRSGHTRTASAMRARDGAEPPARRRPRRRAQRLRPQGHGLLLRLRLLLRIRQEAEGVAAVDARGRASSVTFGGDAVGRSRCALFPPLNGTRPKRRPARPHATALRLTFRPSHGGLDLRRTTPQGGGHPSDRSFPLWVEKWMLMRAHDLQTEPRNL